MIGNLSYYDIVDNQRQRYLKRETVSDDEDNGEFIDSDDERSTTIGTFLESHKIQIALKNPGRLSWKFFKKNFSNKNNLNNFDFVSKFYYYADVKLFSGLH